MVKQSRPRPKVSRLPVRIPYCVLACLARLFVSVPCTLSSIDSRFSCSLPSPETPMALFALLASSPTTHPASPGLPPCQPNGGDHAKQATTSTTPIVGILFPPPPQSGVIVHWTEDGDIRSSEANFSIHRQASVVHTTPRHPHTTLTVVCPSGLPSVRYPPILRLAVLILHPPPSAAAPQFRPSLRSLASQSCGSNATIGRTRSPRPIQPAGLGTWPVQLTQHRRPSRLLLRIRKASIPLSETIHCANRPPVRPFDPAARSNHPSGTLHDNSRGLLPLLPHGALDQYCPCCGC